LAFVPDGLTQQALHRLAQQLLLGFAGALRQPVQGFVLRVCQFNVRRHHDLTPVFRPF
jgi:hypothetical protein